MPNTTLLDLPQEILLSTFAYLSISDLLECSRTCHELRRLCFDPLLHRERRRAAVADLKIQLDKRKTRAEISPPNLWIYLTKSHALSISINHSLVAIRINHNLANRPEVQHLVARSILPAWTNVSTSGLLVQTQRTLQKRRLQSGLNTKLRNRPDAQRLVYLNILPGEYVHGVSPVLLATCRRLRRESMRDGVRAWVERHGIRAQQDRTVEAQSEERHSVQAMVRSLTARCLSQELEMRYDHKAIKLKRAQQQYGRELQSKIIRDKQETRGVPMPTRAHVSRLKRFWESIGKGTTV